MAPLATANPDVPDGQRITSGRRRARAPARRHAAAVGHLLRGGLPDVRRALAATVTTGR